MVMFLATVIVGMIVVMIKMARHYEEGEWVYQEGKSPYVYHSTEYIRQANEKWAKEMGWSSHEEYKANGYRARI